MPWMSAAMAEPASVKAATVLKVTNLTILPLRVYEVEMGLVVVVVRVVRVVRVPR